MPAKLSEPRICSEEGCDNNARARGLCSRHYQQLRLKGPLTPKTPDECFDARVNVTDTCWLWTGGKTHKGYGTFRWPGGTMAHRYSYERYVGPIPEGLEIDHLCRTPSCVNPAHLETVTHRENMLRGDTIAAKHAAKTHCPQGHPYDEANTFMKNGSRECLACRRDRDRRRYWRNRGVAPSRNDE